MGKGEKLQVEDGWLTARNDRKDNGALGLGKIMGLLEGKAGASPESQFIQV